MMRTEGAPPVGAKVPDRATQDPSIEGLLHEVISQLIEGARRAWDENSRVAKLQRLRFGIIAKRTLQSIAIVGIILFALLSLTLLAMLELVRATQTAVAAAYGPSWGHLAAALTGIALVTLGLWIIARGAAVRGRARLDGLTNKEALGASAPDLTPDP